MPRLARRSEHRAPYPAGAAPNRDAEACAMGIKYPGKLGRMRPYQQPPGLLATDEQREAWANKQVAESVAVLDDLFRYYGIETNNWCLLAWRLAEDNVPAMRQERARRGAATKWGFVER